MYYNKSAIVDSIIWIGLTYIISAILIAIFGLICNWMIFKKAGRRGIESIIPIYNTFVYFKILSIPLWYLLLMIVPIVNLFVIVKLNFALAHKFGKDSSFGLLCLFFPVIGYAIIAFGKSEYIGTN